MHPNDIAKTIVDSAYHIHAHLGPGLFESVYESILAADLAERGLTVARQHPIPIQYKDLQFDAAFKADLIVNDTIIVELKSIESIAPIHKKQLLTYLRLAHKPLGLLINFNVEFFKEGITRIVNNL